MIRLLVAWCLLSALGAAPVFAASEARIPYQIGVLYWSDTIPGQLAMRAGLELQVQKLDAAARESGARGLELVPRVAGDGPAGIERQVRQMYELLEIGVDLIIVQPTDSAALTKPLQEANRRGVPVVAYDQYIRSGQLASYLTSDNYQAGHLDGEYVAAAFDDAHTLRLVLVEYPHVSSTVERVNGFLDALAEQGQRYKVVGTYEAVEPVGGAKAGAAILRDFPAKGSLDVVFTVNDGGGLAVVEALAAAGRDEVFVASIDGDPASVRNIERGRLTRVDAAQFCGPLGAEAAKTAYALLQGEPVARHILVPTFPVSRETLHRYPGWMGPIPEGFEKPWPAANPRWQGEIQVRRE